MFPAVSGAHEAETLTGALPESVTVADLNGDGFPEVVTANEASNDVSVVANSAGTALRYAGSWQSSFSPMLAVGHFLTPGAPAILDGLTLLPAQ